jgi:hypothetical protein
MSFLLRSLFIVSLAAMLAPVNLFGQHYLFIEADGQQPFYVKKGDMLYSSSSSGFLIIPKVAKGDVRMVVGFPKGLYPEVSFDIQEVNRDRGFHLKLFEGKGWGLFDRTSLEVIMSAAEPVITASVVSEKNDSNPFAELLSGATGDEALLKKQSVSPKSLPVAPVVAKENKQDKKNTDVLREKAIQPMLIKLEETDSDKRITFIDQIASGQADTVNVQIDKPLLLKNISSESSVQPPMAVTAEPPLVNSSASNAAPLEVDAIEPSAPLIVNTRKLPECNKTLASDKDMFLLQKKLLGISTEEDQIAFVEKSFGLKCYSSKQAVEIASFFLDEGSRLRLFERIYWLVTDHVELKQAGSLFFKEENIQAFKKLQLGN